MKNPEFHKQTKHLDVHYHYISEKLKDGIFSLEYVTSKEQLADIMTMDKIPGTQADIRD